MLRAVPKPAVLKPDDFRSERYDDFDDLCPDDMRRTAATTAAECNGTPTVDFKEEAGAAAAQTKAVNSVPVSNAGPFIAQHGNWLTGLEKKSREPRIFYWITTCLLSCTVLGTPYFWLSRSSFGSTQARRYVFPVRMRQARHLV